MLLVESRKFEDGDTRQESSISTGVTFFFLSTFSSRSASPVPIYEELPQCDQTLLSWSRDFLRLFVWLCVIGV
jgi:hypothetical protein